MSKGICGALADSVQTHIRMRNPIKVNTVCQSTGMFVNLQKIKLIWHPLSFKWICPKACLDIGKHCRPNSECGIIAWSLKVQDFLQTTKQNESDNISILNESVQSTCRSRSDAECGVWSGSPLFAYCTGSFVNILKKQKKKQFGHLF